jgi:hypothetical protein
VLPSSPAAALAPACALFAPAWPEPRSLGENRFESGAEPQAAANGTQTAITEATTKPRANFITLVVADRFAESVKTLAQSQRDERDTAPPTSTYPWRACSEQSEHVDVTLTKRRRIHVALFTWARKFLAFADFDDRPGGSRIKASSEEWTCHARRSGAEGE